MKYIVKVLILLSPLFPNPAEAQYFYDEKTGDEYLITPNTDEKIINAYLNQQKASAIEFNPHKRGRFPFRLENNKGNWILFDSDNESLFMQSDSENYSFLFPEPLMENRNFTLATSQGKTYFVNLYGRGELKTKMGFDEVIPQVVNDPDLEMYVEDGIEEKYIKYLASIAVKSGDKWGVIELADGNIYLSRNFLYDSPEEVPEATGFQSGQLEMMENIRKEHGIDLLVALDENGYYFKARKKETKLFGIYVGEGISSNSIPAIYTDVIRHRNPETFEVWKDGKVGYYNGEFELVFEPVYDDFEFVHLDYTYGCALKKSGKWELYDAYEPEKLVDGSAASIDGLIELWLDR